MLLKMLVSKAEAPWLGDKPLLRHTKKVRRLEILALVHLKITNNRMNSYYFQIFYHQDTANTKCTISEHNNAHNLDLIII